jgi:hypothetical protein
MDRGMDHGYVKIWRKMLFSGLLTSPQVLQLFVWILLRSCYKSTRVLINKTMVTLAPGQSIFGRDAAAKELNSTPRKIRTSLETLKKLAIIDQQTTNRYSIITVINWHTYQGQDSEGDQPRVRQRASKRPANDHIQEVKEGKEVKELKEKDICPEAKEASPSGLTLPDEIVFTFECLSGKKYLVTKAKAEAWAEAFPAVDVRIELKRMAIWLEDNPANRKTEKGFPRFATKWLSRAQNQAGRIGRNRNALTSGKATMGSVATDLAEKLRAERLKNETGGSGGDSGQDRTALPSMGLFDP